MITMNKSEILQELQNMTQRGEVNVHRLTGCRLSLNLQFVKKKKKKKNPKTTANNKKPAMSAKHNKTKSNKRRYAFIPETGF